MKKSKHSSYYSLILFVILTLPVISSCSFGYYAPANLQPSALREKGDMNIQASFISIDPPAGGNASIAAAITDHVGVRLSGLYVSSSPEADSEEGRSGNGKAIDLNAFYFGKFSSRFRYEVGAGFGYNQILVHRKDTSLQADVSYLKPALTGSAWWDYKGVELGLSVQFIALTGLNYDFGNLNQQQANDLFNITTDMYDKDTKTNLNFGFFLRYQYRAVSFFSVFNVSRDIGDVEWEYFPSSYQLGVMYHFNHSSSGN